VIGPDPLALDSGSGVVFFFFIYFSECVMGTQVTGCWQVFCVQNDIEAAKEVRQKKKYTKRCTRLFLAAKKSL
jgi:hypothetical protein